ncbi:MAG: tetratricopeptide repeat protein [Candidatus Korobacteraceae bacterium]
MAASSSPVPPRVFISYTHDTPEHEGHMWDLSEQLRSDGVECHIDQEEQSPAGGWPSWCSDQIKKADSVLIVCTETYGQRYEGKGTEGKGRGGNWEGLLIRQSIYNVRGQNSKFIPVIVAASDAAYIPTELQGPTHYDLSTDDGYDDLLRLITGQPKRRPSEVAREVRRMTPLEQKTLRKQATTPPKQLFTVPFRPNPFFTGREDALDGLKKTLDSSGIAALTGMGGVGKTQTAAHYAHRHRNDYPFVLWVRAESAETLFADLTQLAARLELPEREAKDQSIVVAAVERWLDEHEGWLLVLDNVEEYDLVRDLARKANENGRHVIITTQRQALGQIGRQKLPSMEQEQGALLLLHRAGRLPADKAWSAADPKEAALARQISEEVGGLPLALDQAGAYIEESEWPLEDYLQALRQELKELTQQREAVDSDVSKAEELLVGRRGGLDADHQPVLKTFSLSFDKLAGQHPAAAELLKAAAFLPPDAIPEEIFTEGAAEFGPVLGAAAGAPRPWNDAIAAARKLSLLERYPEKKMLAVHRMVQAVARSRMSAEHRKQWAEQMVRAVNAAFPNPEFAVWDKCERLTPSAQVCAGLVDEYHLSITEAAVLLNQAGYYLDDRARYAEAEPLYRKALTIAEKSHGAEHPNVASPLNNLATLLQETNRSAEAEPLLRRVIKIFEAGYGLGHPNVATSLNNLAEVLRATNRLGEAEPLHRRALAIWEKELGSMHPQVATGLSNLAVLLQDTSRPGEAEPLMRRALEIDEHAHGHDHPDVAIRLTVLARLLFATNRLAEAEPRMRRVVEIFEKAYGPDHPNVAISLNNLAQLLRGTNRLGEAEPLMRRALQISERSLGPEHPSVAIRLNNLALLLLETNRLAEAEPLMRRALEAFQNSLGPERPDTIMVRKNLAGLLRQMGKNAEADKL